MRIKFYDKIQDMECLQGDTLDTFSVEMGENTDLTGASMMLIVENQDGLVLPKACTLSGQTFSVQLTSEDTANLTGLYQLHFCLTDADGLKYRKIVGTLHVSKAAQGV